jgi:hypothetical protein
MDGFRVLTGAVLSLGLLSVDARGNTTNLPLGACAKLAGTYLTSVFTPTGDFLLRGLLTFTPTGAMFVVESAQGGLEGIVNPYSDAQGAWKCVAKQGDTIEAQATVLARVRSARSNSSHGSTTTYPSMRLPGRSAARLSCVCSRYRAILCIPRVRLLRSTLPRATA